MNTDPRLLAPTSLAFALALLAACGPGAQLGEPEPLTDTTVSGLGTFSEVTNFGSNPGALKMYTYVPSPAPAANAPVVFALHACSQTATDYQKAGWNTLADEWGFYVVYPEQQTANNPLRCFNWAGEYSDPTNLHRAQGENQSIIQMVDKMKTDHSVDAHKIFIMGHSGGAAQSALMLAVWPDVFSAGAMIAGIPYDCTTSYNEVTTCLNPGINRTPMEWGDRARMGDPGYSGTWPRISIWQGTSDTVVNPANGTELLDQWTNVHGIDETADAMDTVDGFPHREFKNASGTTLVETYELTGMNHGTPVVPGMNCGTTGSYFLDVGICASRHIGTFFGLDSSAGDHQAPAVNISAPTGGATVNGTVTVRVDASDDTAVDRVELYVNGTLVTTMQHTPYTYTWDTSQAANGSYSLRALAYDAAGNVGTDDDTSVTVSGGVNDTMPPAVNITAPASGGTVSGTVQITADASDNFGVARVEFFVDGAKIGESTSSPYSVTWDTSGAAAGSHAISATAHDGAGNQATDNDTSVTVSAMAMDTTPPVVTITAPAAGATVGGLIKVQVGATDDTGLKTALLFLDDNLIGSDYHDPFEFLWDTSTFPSGQHKLTARVFDPAGNAGVAEIMVTVDQSAAQMGGDMGEDGPVVVGRRHWGCSTTAAMPTDARALFVLLAGAIFMLRRKNIRRTAILAACAVAALAACEGEEITVNSHQAQTGKYSSPAKISAYLDGKSLVMTGAAIPSDPNGYNENVNFGQATQCYHKVTMTPLAGRYHVASELGTLMNAPNPGTHGSCDHDTMSAELSFDSTAVLVENVKDNGNCFDFTVTYPGFGQEGRGSLSEDGKTLVLELFFKDQATGHRCADGNVGDPTVTLSQMQFTGDARQTYDVTE